MIDSDGEEEFLITRLWGMRTRRKKRQFLIEWAPPYADKTYDAWENEENIDSEMVRSFLLHNNPRVTLQLYWFQRQGRIPVYLESGCTKSKRKNK